MVSNAPILLCVPGCIMYGTAMPPANACCQCFPPMFPASTMDRQYVAQLTLGSGAVIPGVSFGIPPSASVAAFTNLPVFDAFSFAVSALKVP